MNHRAADGERAYRDACRRGWEGVIAKNGASAYVTGRSREWLKFKCSRAQEFIIGGYTDPRGSRVGFGALLLGYYDRGALRYAGKVGTGFDDQLLRELARTFRKLAAPTPPFADPPRAAKGVHWVKPQLVAQIAFTEWTADGKLRHPRFLGLRDDKEPKDVVREERPESYAS